MAIAAAVFLFTWVFGHTYAETPRDKAELQKKCDPYRVVPVALAEHFARHRKYPVRFSDLDKTVPHAAAASAAMARNEGFIYTCADGRSYTIYKKLNWDGGLDYQSERGKWYYGINDDPGWPVD